jgi:hypothetical protein
MNWFKGLNELGKSFMNLAVALIVFAIIQPFVKGEFSISITVVSVVISAILFFIGVSLSSLGGRDHES